MALYVKFVIFLLSISEPFLEASLSKLDGPHAKKKKKKKKII